MNPEEFVAAIFTDVPDDERVCVTRPGPDGGWINYPATPRRLARMADQDVAWYFGISTVAAPDEDGYLPRDRASCRYTYCIVLDDIGTKCAEPPVAPSWKLESSEGNFQWGYLIDPVPSSEVTFIEGAQTALAQAGWSDMGARGTYRVMRLPGSLHKTGFRARVVDWHPERSWSLQGLLDAFGLELAAVNVSVSDSEPVEIGSVDDPLLDWLSAHGMTTGVVGPKFVEVICPWAASHTSGGDTAGYTPVGYGGVFDGAFSCFHDHCQGKGKRDFIEWAESEGYVAPGTDVSDAPAVVELEPISKYDLPDLALDGNGNAKAVQHTTQANVKFLLDWLGVDCRVNVMTGMREVGGATIFQATLDVYDYCQKLGMKDKQTLRDILELLCDRAPYHPFADWLNGLPAWDGVDRVQQLIDAVVTPEPLWSTYLRRWLAQVRVGATNWCAAEPVQLPYVLVLTGRQGTGKSTFFTRLVPRAFFLGDVELHLNGPQSKDHQLNALSRSVCELGELDSTFGQSYVGALKSFLARTVDSIRAPYDRTPVVRARSTVFCASVNPTEFLQDTTGNRRWWPVLVERIDWDAVNRVDQQQLWAQVVAEDLEYSLSAKEQRDHAILSDAYAHRSHLRDVFDAYYGALVDVPESEYVEMSMMQIAAELKVEHEVKAPKNRAELSGLLRSYFGEPRRAGRDRIKRYLVPKRVLKTGDLG